jgi:hypothetical protein
MSTHLHPELKAAHSKTIATLLEVTDDPIDAMKLAADLFAMSAYRAERAVALEAGLTMPRAPKPQSKYVFRFATALKEKMTAIAKIFDANEIERLKKLGPMLARRLERNDSDLAEQVFELACMAPEDAATWIREHIGEIETRFAS